jgi:uncharacterized protein YndB with AHSA1/START domain
MRMLLFIVGGIVAVVILLIMVMLVIGSRLDPKHVASRSIRLSRPPAEVYALIHDFQRSPEWRADVKKVELLGNVEGHLRFREEGSNGTVTYEVLDDVPAQRLVTRIVDKDLGYSGSWTYVLTPAEGGTALTITENGEVSNPLFRFMSKYIFGHTATMDTYLKSLGARFGQVVKPEDAK